MALLAACAESASDTPDPFGGAPPPVSGVDVDTATLRQLRSAAGIEPCPRTEPRPGVAGGLPDIALPCLGGGRDVNLAGLRGPMVVNLWASWCEPCRQELPVLQEYAERARRQVRVLGVDFEDTRPAAALELARRSGVRYPLVADLDGATRRALRAGGLPWTVIVDADGRIARTLPGQLHSVDELDAAVEEAAGVSVGG
jgi:thiol-disulfide isomerase/thioredoxin